MNFQKFGSGAILFCSILLGASSLCAQGVLLKGKVVDATANNSPIPGVEITIRRDKITLQTTTSLADGTYQVKGLSKYDHIDAYFSRVGYKPDPLPVAIVLSNQDNIHDAALIHDVDDPNSWQLYWKVVKAQAESTTPDKGKQFRIYEMKWSELNKIGLSPEAKRQAGQQLIFVSPLGDAVVAKQPGPVGDRCPNCG
jgi:hypothetical protein